MGLPRRTRLLAIAVASALAGGSAACLPADWGANAILRPHRRVVSGAPDIAHREVTFDSGGVRLRGWFFPHRGGAGGRRGLIVYLHGSADNRGSGVGIAQRFGPRGYDVLSYDGRAHGTSGGEACTYGFYEKHDLVAALDHMGAPDAILFGSSLGAAVALQAAAIEPRVRGVIAQSSFSTLRRIVHERARRLPVFATTREIDAALALAEQRASFRADEASPLAAASRIKTPVLLVHGDRDKETSASHSAEIDRALQGPHRLLLVEGAGHNDVLTREAVWTAIEAFVTLLSPARPRQEAAPDR